MAEQEKQSTTVVELIENINDAITDIKREQGNDYRGCIFRGEPSDQYDEASSSLYRKLKKPDIVSTERMTDEQLAQFPEDLCAQLAERIEKNGTGELRKGDVLEAAKEVLSYVAEEKPVSEQFRKSALQQLQKSYARGAKQRAGSIKFDVEILAELQHYGGETNLIDFSESYLVGLFFACNDDSYSEEDGRLIILPKWDIKEIPSNEQIPEGSRFIIRPLPDNRRALVQHSVMLHEPEGYLEYDKLKSVPIPSKLKKAVLSHLAESCNVSAATIFPDIPGYIESQKFVRRSMGHLAQAYTRLEKGEYEEALRMVTQALKLDDKNAESYRFRAEILLNLKRYERVISDCNNGLDLDDKNFSLYELRTKARIHLKDYEGALSDCNQGIGLNDGTAMLYMLRAQVHLELGHLETFISDSTHAIKLDDKNAELYNDRALLRLKFGDSQNALKDCDRALRLDDKNAELYNTRAKVRLDLGLRKNGLLDRDRLKHCKEALLDCEDAIRLNSRDSRLYSTRVCVLMSLGRYEEALSDCNQALGLNGSNPLLYHARAEAYMSLGRYEEELKDCSYAIELDSNNATSYWLRARIYNEMRCYDEALSDCTRGLELDNENLKLYQLRAQVYRNTKCYDEALKDCDRGIKLDNWNPTLYWLRTNIYYELERYDEALENINRIERSTKFVWLRARICVKLGRYEEALENYIYAWEIWAAEYEAVMSHELYTSTYNDNDKKFYEEVLNYCNRKIESDHKKYGTLYGVRALIYDETKCYSEALKDCDKGLGLTDKDFRLYWLRARVCRSMRRYDEALDDCSSALVHSLDGSNFPLRIVRAQIYKEQGKWKKAKTDLIIALRLAREQENMELAEKIREEQSKLNTPNPQQPPILTQ